MSRSLSVPVQDELPKEKDTQSIAILTRDYNRKRAFLNTSQLVPEVKNTVSSPETDMTRKLVEGINEQETISGKKYFSENTQSGF
ncbi:26479_t:CDS:2 [Dentiscutata erythropus]|uniref:26479_t:CDS:1 n=1 Tax=Dentiscutata erythropus TaxID=1348616 RepID=A0A9N9BUA5_9GLOM|nr:26479_t:CDS:2 [Dentiscutata erythropus]